MLDPDNDSAVASEDSPGEQEWKRQLILMNALRAARQLEQKNSNADRQALVAAVEKLLSPKYEGAVNLEIREAARDLVAGPK
jgi:hypothetical protein